MATAPLPCSTILFRAIVINGGTRADGRIKWQAFKRMLKDADGVSLFVSPETASAVFDEPVKGLMSVHVGRVRDASDEAGSLDVVQDSKTHALITGIPYPYDCENDDERLEMEGRMTSLCNKLAKTAARLIPISD